MPIIIREIIPFIESIYNLFQLLLLSGIYIEIGIDWNRLNAGNRIISIKIVLLNSHDNYRLNWNYLDVKN
jgi:hypothetical protein